MSDELKLEFKHIDFNREIARAASMVRTIEVEPELVPLWVRILWWLDDANEFVYWGFTFIGYFVCLWWLASALLSLAP